MKPSPMNRQCTYFCCHYNNLKKGPPLECGVPSDPIAQGVYKSMSPLVKTTFLSSIWVRDKRWQRSDANKQHRSYVQTTFLRADTKNHILWHMHVHFWKFVLCFIELVLSEQCSLLMISKHCCTSFSWITIFSVYFLLGKHNTFIMLEVK